MVRVTVTVAGVTVHEQRLRSHPKPRCLAHPSHPRPKIRACRAREKAERALQDAAHDEDVVVAIGAGVAKVHARGQAARRQRMRRARKRRAARATRPLPRRPQPPRRQEPQRRADGLLKSAPHTGPMKTASRRRAARGRRRLPARRRERPTSRSFRCRRIRQRHHHRPSLDRAMRRERRQSRIRLRRLARRPQRRSANGRGALWRRSRTRNRPENNCTRTGGPRCPLRPPATRCSATNGPVIVSTTLWRQGRGPRSARRSSRASGALPP